MTKLFLFLFLSISLILSSCSYQGNQKPMIYIENQGIRTLMTNSDVVVPFYPPKGAAIFGKVKPKQKIPQIIPKNPPFIKPIPFYLTTTAKIIYYLLLGLSFFIIWKKKWYKPILKFMRISYETNKPTC